MAISKAALRCKKKFLRFFPGGYSDETYYDWEREIREMGRRRRLAAAQTDASPDVAGRHGLRIHRRARSPHLPQAQRHAPRRARIRIRFRVSIEANWDTYASLLEFAEKVRRDTRDLRPKDMIDLQPFLWVQGSEEYEE